MMRAVSGPKPLNTDRNLIGLTLLLISAWTVCAQIPAAAQDEVRAGVIPCLRLEESDLAAAFGIISSYSGIEIIASSTVKGTVSLVLENATWQEALDTLCAMAGLVPVAEAKYIFVLPRQEQLQPALSAEPRAAAVCHENLALRFADAAQADSALRPLLSRSGTLQFADSLRCFRVADSAAFLDRIRDRFARIESRAMRLRLQVRLFRLDPKLRESLEWTAPVLRKPLQPADSLLKADPRTGFRVARLPTDAGALRAAFGKLESGLLAESTLVLAGLKETAVFLGEPVTLPIVESNGRQATRTLDPGMRISVSPVCRNDHRIGLELEMERRSYLIDPAVGLVPDHAKSEFAVDTAEGTPVLICSFSGEDGPDLAILILPKAEPK